MGVYGSLAPPSGLGFSFVFWSFVFWPGVCGVGVGFWVRNFGVCVLEVSAFGGQGGRVLLHLSKTMALASKWNEYLCEYMRV